MRSNISDVTTPKRLERGRFLLDVADGWQQGRGAFGGLVLGALVRAMETELGDPTRPMRSLSGELVGAVQPGEGRVSVEILRSGNGLSLLEARLEQGGEVQARATGIFAKTRTHDRDGLWLTPPANVPDPSTLDPLPIPPPPLGPVFAQHWDFWATAAFPYSGHPVPEAMGWLRPKQIDAWSAAEVTCCADGWWGTSMAMESGPRPIATVAFSLEIVVDPATLVVGDALCHRAHGLAGSDGYHRETRELWTKDGRLVSLNHQNLCIIR